MDRGSLKAPVVPGKDEPAAAPPRRLGSSAVEDVQADLGVAGEAAAPARVYIVGVIPENVLRQQAPGAGLGDAGNGHGLAPRFRPAIRRRDDAVADEGELPGLGDDVADRRRVAAR